MEKNIMQELFGTPAPVPPPLVHLYDKYGTSVREPVVLSWPQTMQGVYDFVQALGTAVYNLSSGGVVHVDVKVWDSTERRYGNGFSCDIPGGNDAGKSGT